MSSFINKILREAEDSSDDFFQDKHINKRKEDLKNMTNKMKHKFVKGLRNIKEDYKNSN